MLWLAPLALANPSLDDPATAGLLAACHAGGADACGSLAEAWREVPYRAAAFRVQACIAGHQASCKALEPDPEDMMAQGTFDQQLLSPMREACEQEPGWSCSYLASRGDPIRWLGGACTAGHQPSCKDLQDRGLGFVHRVWADVQPGVRPHFEGDVVKLAQRSSSARDEPRDDGQLEVRVTALNSDPPLRLELVQGESTVLLDLAPMAMGEKVVDVQQVGERVLVRTNHRLGFFDLTSGALDGPLLEGELPCGGLALHASGAWAACSSYGWVAVLNLGATDTPAPSFSLDRSNAGTDASTPETATLTIENRQDVPVRIRRVTPSGESWLEPDADGAYTAPVEYSSLVRYQAVGDGVISPALTRLSTRGSTLKVAPSRTVELQVLGATGRPASGARVFAVQNGKWIDAGTTDGAGRVALRLLSGRRAELVAQGSGGSLAVLELEGSADPQPLRLQTEGDFDRRKFVDERGQPLADVRPVGSKRWLRSGEDGWLPVPRLRSGKPGTSVRRGRASQLRIPTEGEQVTLGTGTLRVERDDDPPDAQYFAAVLGEQPATRASFDRGHLRYDALPAGSWTVLSLDHRRPRSAYDTVHVEPGQTVDLTPGWSEQGVSGVVRHEDGWPAGLVTVSANCTGELAVPSGPWCRTRAAPDGSFTLPGLSGPGPWRVRAGYFGVRSSFGEVVVESLEDPIELGVP